MSFLEVLLLSFIEGVTEYLPISSTGHLILTSKILGINDDGFVKNFNIIIQFGAILAVLVLYWRRFLPQKDFYLRIIVGFLPAAIIGLAVKEKIDLLLGSVLTVAIALIVGGIILIWCDRSKYFQNRVKFGDINQLPLKYCLGIGLVQCFAFIPGVSRSAASILGGLFFGLNKKDAAEFSFFLAVPTLTGAALIKTLKIAHQIQSHDLLILLAGLFGSFVFAILAIKFFISILTRFGFTYFGYYRIAVGIIVLLSLSFGGSP